MSRAADGTHKGSVRFAEEPLAPSPRPAAATTASVPHRVECKFGFLLVGGIYCTDLLELEAAAPGDSHQGQEPVGSATAAAPQQQPEVRGLVSPNLSVAFEHPGDSNSGGSTLQRVVLRLWAEQEGPFEADFALVLPPGQEIEVHVTATVFSRKKGTPGLKPHVRCLGFSTDADTEAASDWQGFE